MGRSRYRIKWFRVILLVIVGCFIYTGINLQSKINTIHSETKAAAERLEQLKQVNARLVEERNKLHDPAYIEKLAREELGLVKPGEVPYLQAGKN